MSLLSFIPFIHNKNTIRSEAIIKYFIVQRVASTIFLFRVIYMLIGVNIINEIIITIAILVKLGSAPFHNWVLIIIETINYLVILVLLTVLKIPPLSILYQINTKILAIPIALRIIVRSISCINQSSVRKTLGYSSIYNIRLLLISINKFNIVMIFISMYSFILFLLVSLVKTIKINFINQIISNEFRTWLKINLWINILSIGGFPPLIGFIAKIIVIQTLIDSDQLTILTLMIFTSLIVMIFYMRMAFTAMINLYSFKKWTINKTKPVYFLMSLNIIVTPLVITLVRIS